MGNNNTVFQDNELNWINWENAKTARRDRSGSPAMIIAFRKRHSIVRRWRYLTGDADDTPMLRNITWHGVKPGQPDFGERLAVHRLDARGLPDRASGRTCRSTSPRTPSGSRSTIELPETPDRRWYRVVDTSLPVGEDIVPEEEAFFLPELRTTIQPRSTIVCVAR